MTERQLDTLPKINVKLSQHIGSGAYGKVYRISERRVVKVIRSKKYLLDELRGSKLSKYALPVIRVVRVHTDHVYPPRFLGYGLVKKYLPYGSTQEEFEKLRLKIRSPALWSDLRRPNIRRDYNGKVYLIDTQTSEVLGDSDRW